MSEFHPEFTEIHSGTLLVPEKTPQEVFAHLKKLGLENFRVGKNHSFIYGSIIVEIVEGGSSYEPIRGVTLTHPGKNTDTLVMIETAHKLTSSWKMELEIITSQIKYHLKYF